MCCDAMTSMVLFRPHLSTCLSSLGCRIVPFVKVGRVLEVSRPEGRAENKAGHMYVSGMSK